MKCWWCGIEPEREIDTSALGSAFSTTVAGRWPYAAADHEHAELPPTAAQLEQAGHTALMRIRDLALSS